MSEEALTLQVGGTLNPRKHIYIQRPEDEQLLTLLKQGQFCNVLSPRQMGKSSLMARTVYRLRESGISAVSIDLAGDLGTPDEPQDWFLDLVGKVARDLDVDLDVENWWRGHVAKTTSQRLMRFFGEELPLRVGAPVVVFLDEIDSALRLPYSDDLFLSLRTLSNDRALEQSHRQITFCLLGVAVPDQLVKSRMATAYNVGQTIELRDFDEDRDDLSPLCRYLSRDPETGRSLLRRVLYWTGGQPYLTTKICKELADADAADSVYVDVLAGDLFSNREGFWPDVHFEQVARFFDARATDKKAALEIYRKILRTPIPDQGARAYTELRMSGLVKRREDGFLVIRNRIYERIFSPEWARKNESRKRLLVDGGSDAAYEEPFRLRTRIALPSYAIVAVACVFAGMLYFGATTVAQKDRELRMPRAVSFQALTLTGTTRGPSPIVPIEVPEGIEYFGVELEASEGADFSAYRVELRNNGGETIWSSDSLNLDLDGTIRVVFSRSFLPEGTYRAMLYGIPSNGIAQLVAEYPMPIVYVGAQP